VERRILIGAWRAIETFLQDAAERETRRKTLLSLTGCLSRKDEDELRRTAREFREIWR
jgi:hypothetical protein